jgi:hypothetical protein
MNVEQTEKDFKISFEQKSVVISGDWSNFQVLTCLQNFFNDDLIELVKLRTSKMKRKENTKKYYLKNKDELKQRSKERYKILKQQKI